MGYKKRNKTYKQYETIKRFEKFVTVDDDWYPNWDGNKVKVSLTLFGSYIKFCAWGADDTGVEMEFCSSNESVFELWKTHIYDKIPDIVNKEWFYDHGFYPA